MKNWFDAEFQSENGRQSVSVKKKKAKKNSNKNKCTFIKL